MPGSARWDQDPPEDSRESTVDLPRLTNDPESPEPAPPRAASAPYREAPRQPPPAGGHHPAEPWLDGPPRPAASGSWDETGSWPTRPPAADSPHRAPADRPARHSDPRRAAQETVRWEVPAQDRPGPGRAAGGPALSGLARDPALAAPPPASGEAAGPAFGPAGQAPGEPDPALTELAERIREFQALTGRPAPPLRAAAPAPAPSGPSFPASEPLPPASGRRGRGSGTPPPSRDEPAPRGFEGHTAEPASPASESARAPDEPDASASDQGTSGSDRAFSPDETHVFGIDPSIPGGEAAVSASEPAISDGPDVSQSHANYESARQDYSVSDLRAAEPPSAADGEYAAHEDPAPAPRGRGGEFSGSQGYTSGQEHRAMDRRRGPADGAGMPPDRPARGSLTELRLRLERLPAGHPSSPYDETGARRPAPEQLRQLELPLADEDEHPTRASLLTAAAEDRGGAAASRPASSGSSGTSPAPAPVQPAVPAAPPSASDRNGTGGDALGDRGLSDLRPIDNGVSDYARSDTGLSDLRPSENGRARRTYRQDGFGPAEPGLGHAEPSEPAAGDYVPRASDPDEPDELGRGQYGTDPYDNGHYGDGPPDRDEPDRDEPDRPEYRPGGTGRNGSGWAGSGPGGSGAGGDPLGELAGSGSARPPAFGRLAGSGSRHLDDLAVPGAAASALPSRNGHRDHDDPSTSGVMPRVGGTGPLPARNGQRAPDGPGLLPRVPGAEPLPARNGHRDHDDPAARLTSRVADPEPLPSRTGRSDQGDPDEPASGLLPRVTSAEPLPERNGSGRPGPRPGGRPRGIAGDVMPPHSSDGWGDGWDDGRDDSFSEDWPGLDTAAVGRSGLARSRAGAGELERTRVPTQVVPREELPREEAPDEPPRRPHAGLTPEQESIADAALSRYKAADGRNVFGGYGESGLTPAMRRVEAHLPNGRLAPDSDQHSLKSPERYKDKLAALIARHPGIPAADLAAEIYDAARYAFVFEPPDYTDGTWLVHRRLKAQGFDLEARRNRWDTPELKGIRTRWRDPAHDLAFEVQFHTPASWDVVQRTHEAYLRITDPRTPAAERAELRERQVAAAAGTRPPARYTEIGDFRADAR
jgi:hypothetical protein